MSDKVFVDIGTQTEDIETSTIPDSNESHSYILFYESFNETEYAEFMEHLTFVIHEYIDNHIGQMHKPNFHNELIENVSHELFEMCIDMELSMTDDDYDAIEEMVTTQLKEDIQLGVRSMPHHMYSVLYHQYHIDEETERELISESIRKLRMVPQQEQRTREWYEARYNRLTASNAYLAFGTDAQRNRLIYEKCKPLSIVPEVEYTNTSSPMHWGTKYEPLTLMLYQQKTGVKSVELFGCIPHSEYAFLGASPDGIVTDETSPLYGRMVEIKNIVNREIDGIPSEAYWIQMQLQLECCNLEACDFVETRFIEYSSEDEFWEDTAMETKGVILYFIKKGNVSNSPTYLYMPLSVPLTQDAIATWINERRQEMSDTHVLYKINYWYLDEYSISLVIRNQAWFAWAYPKIAEIWSIIECERGSGYEHRSPQKRIAKSKEKESICVIKIDI